MHIKLESLIISLTFINVTSTPPPEVKKRVQYIVHIITLCTSTETSICKKFKDKIFNLFEAPNQYNCCATVLWKFFEVLTCVLGKIIKCNKLAVHFKLPLDMIFVGLYKYLNFAADKTFDAGHSAING